MTTQAPPQHLQSLQEANRIRVARANLKKQLKRGELTAAEALEHPIARRLPAAPHNGAKSRGMTVGELLRAQDRWGRLRTVKFLGRFAISENRRVGDLTERQRHVLSEALGG